MSHYTIEELAYFSDCQKDVIKIHLSELDKGFLSSLGENALNLLFSHAAESQFGRLFITKDAKSEQIVGFLLGTTGTGVFYKDFIFKKFKKAVFVIAPKLLSQNIVRKIFETLFYPTKRELKLLPKSELLDLAVKKEYQGKGVAQLLFQQFVKNLNASGIEKFKIVTGDSLVRAQRFYEKLGAEKIAEIEIHKGKKSWIYTYTISQTTGDE